MNEPQDNEVFLVDLEHGYHYHAQGCQATDYSPYSNYIRLTYGEIKRKTTKAGQPFIPHYCTGLLGLRIR